MVRGVVGLLLVVMAGVGVGEEVERARIMPQTQEGVDHLVLMANRVTLVSDRLAFWVDGRFWSMAGLEDAIGVQRERVFLGRLPMLSTWGPTEEVPGVPRVQQHANGELQVQAPEIVLCDPLSVGTGSVLADLVRWVTEVDSADLPVINLTETSLWAEACRLDQSARRPQIRRRDNILLLSAPGGLQITGELEVQGVEELAIAAEMNWLRVQNRPFCPRQCEDNAAACRTNAYVYLDDFVCNSKHDGGGWMLAAASVSDGLNTWTWNRRTLLSERGPNIGAPSTVGTTDFRSAYVLEDVNFRDLFFLHEPSGHWASYHDVGDYGQSLMSYFASVVPACFGPSFPMATGTLVDKNQNSSSRLCDTRLYIHPQDKDGNVGYCPRSAADDTYGPAWSGASSIYSSGCPMDDPGYFSMGADYRKGHVERNGRGFAHGMNVNEAPLSRLLMFVR